MSLALASPGGVWRRWDFGATSFWQSDIQLALDWLFASSLSKYMNFNIVIPHGIHLFHSNITVRKMNTVEKAVALDPSPDAGLGRLPKHSSEHVPDIENAAVSVAGTEAAGEWPTFCIWTRIDLCMAEDATPDLPPLKGLSFLDRFLVVWIILAMAIGIILGNTVPSTGPALQKGQFVGVSVPIGRPPLLSPILPSTYL
jgi:hypothetical protein